MTLLRKIETHLRMTKTTPSRFGRDAARDPRLVRDMRNGREIGKALSKRISTYLREVSL